MHPFLIAVAALPLIFRVIPAIVPASYLESYNYWSSEELNRLPGESRASRQWRNIGYWRVGHSQPTTS